MRDLSIDLSTLIDQELFSPPGHISAFLPWVQLNWILATVWFRTFQRTSICFWNSLFFVVIKLNIMALSAEV